MRITVGRNMWALLEPIGSEQYQVMMVNRIPQLKVGCIVVKMTNGWVAWEAPSPTPVYRFPSRAIVEPVPTHGGEEE
tara:strand:+ start:819 stop:1049 length:231 start_codon:yes stop_codon:yes gene_type:complete